MDGSKHEELSDDVLEREIEAVLGVDPSPEFLPRLRARMSDERVHLGRPWSSSRHWMGAVAAAAAVAFVALWSMRDPVPAPREVRISAPAVEPLGTAPESPGLQNQTQPARVASADSPAPEDRAVARTVRSTRQQVELAQYEVVVSRDEVVALQHLVGAIAARQVKAVDIPTLGAESAPLPAIEEIVLEPITLSPMDEALE
jgi:hypothetical protein